MTSPATKKTLTTRRKELLALTDIEDQRDDPHDHGPGRFGFRKAPHPRVRVAPHPLSPQNVSRSFAVTTTPGYSARISFSTCSTGWP